ncbi:MAG: hypothetical protein H2057_07855 [Alphaproteobacteria bacterium]|nr:hypothetical protein [Alphaproteobacteria bacterium]
MEDNFFKKFGQKTQQKAREDRLAKALRENLRKRKYQQRARIEQEEPVTDEDSFENAVFQEGERAPENQDTEKETPK